jgi:hypothetical protein
MFDKNIQSTNFVLSKVGHVDHVHFILSKPKGVGSKQEGGREREREPIKRERDGA